MILIEKKNPHSELQATKTIIMESMYTKAPLKITSHALLSVFVFLLPLFLISCFGLIQLENTFWKKNSTQKSKEKIKWGLVTRRVFSGIWLWLSCTHFLRADHVKNNNQKNTCKINQENGTMSGLLFLFFFLSSYTHSLSWFPCYLVVLLNLSGIHAPLLKRFWKMKVRMLSITAPDLPQLVCCSNDVTSSAVLSLLMNGTSVKWLHSAKVS